MSELMDEAVIRMPFDMAMESELSRKQFYDRANSALSELIELRQRIADAENQEPSGYVVIGNGISFYRTTLEEAEYQVAALELRGDDSPTIQPRYAKPVPADKPAVAVPDGWKLVPMEITDAMADASGCEGQYRLSAHEQAASIWSAMLEAAPSHSQQSADSSESLREIIEREADRFFEWPSADKSHVTAVSTKLFAEHIATLYASPNSCQSHESKQGGKQTIWSGGRVGNAE